MPKPPPRIWEPQPNLGSPRQQPPAPAPIPVTSNETHYGLGGLRGGALSLLRASLRQSVCVSVRWAPSLFLLPILAIYGRGERRLEAAHLTSECPGMGCCHPWVVLATTVDISSDLT